MTEPPGPRFYAWVADQAHQRRWSLAHLARTSGVHASAFTRWKNGEISPTVEACRSLARVLDQPTLVVLVEAGILYEDEVSHIIVRERFEDATDQQVLEELLNRKDRFIGRPAGT